MKKFEVMPLDIYGGNDDAVARRNMQQMELAKFEQNKEAIDKNLLAQHRLMIATLLLAVVAVISTISAIIIALTAQPPAVTIKVQAPAVSAHH